MMAMGSSLLVYLLTLLMALSPVSGDAAPGARTTGEMILRDVVVTLNGETYELGVDGRLACSTDGEAADVEFALDAGGEQLFPGRLSFDGEHITAMLDGMSKSFALTMNDITGAPDLDSLAEEDEAFASQLQSIRELEASYKDLVRLAIQKGNEGLEAEFAGLEDLIDRGEPADSELEFDDGQKFATQCWTYTITKDDIADLLDGVLGSDGEFGAALNRYMDAVLALAEEDFPEGGFARFFREQEDVDIVIDVTEHVNEAEALDYQELLMRITAEGETIEFPVYVMAWGDTQTVDTYIDVPGTSFGFSAEMTEDEEGRRAMADFSVQNTEVSEDAGIEAEPVEYPEGETAEEDAAVIGGADEPTDIYVASSIAATPVMNGHVEYTEGVADENGTRAFDMVYRLEFYAGDEAETVTLACGGTETEADGVRGSETDFTVSANVSGVDFKVTGTLVTEMGGEREIALPAAESVNPAGDDQQAVQALATEALGLAMQDYGKLMQLEGVSGLVNAFTTMADEPVVETIEDAEYEDEVEVDPAFEFQQVESAAEAAERFGAELPFGETLAGMRLESAEASQGAAYLTYALDGADQEAMVSVFRDESDDARFRMGEDGTLTADEGDLFYVYGDEATGYWSVAWKQGDLQIDISFMQGASFEDINGVIAEVYAGE